MNQLLNARSMYIATLLHHYISEADSTTVEFIKADGSERVMVCTNNPDIIEECLKKDTSKKKKVNEFGAEALPQPLDLRVFRTFDLEANDFRSFRFDSVTKINGLSFSQWISLDLKTFCECENDKKCSSG